MKRPAYRPAICEICHAPLTHAATGRPRRTCSDRCRQERRRRYDYHGWRDPRAADQRIRRAERTLRRLERASGPVSDEVPRIRTISDSSVSPRRRLLIHLERGDPILTCPLCRKPYLREFQGAGRDACSPACRAELKRRADALREGVCLDPRVAVRVDLGLPIKLCAHCRQPFPPYSKRRKYCSDRCRYRAYRIRNPRCRECKRRFPRSKNNGLRHQHCSRACYLQHQKRTVTRCLYCRRVVKLGADVDGYCSGRCRDAAGWLPQRKVCEWCGEAYYPKSPAWQRTQRYCCKTCKIQAKNLRERPRRRGRHKAKPNPRPASWPTQGQCELCGKDFPFGKSNWHSKRFCSPRCRARVRRLRKRQERQRERFRDTEFRGIVAQEVTPPVA